MVQKLIDQAGLSTRLIALAVSAVFIFGAGYYSSSGSAAEFKKNTEMRLGKLETNQEEDSKRLSEIVSTLSRIEANQNILLAERHK